MPNLRTSYPELRYRVYLVAEYELSVLIDGSPVSGLHSAHLTFLRELLPLEPCQLDGEPCQASQLLGDLDLADVRGQETVKRAITLAAAGAYNVLTLCPVLARTATFGLRAS
jgi:magnesium chelatase family protein